MARISILILGICMSQVICLHAQKLLLNVSGPEQDPLEGAIIFGIAENWTLYTNREGQVSVPPADSILISYLGLLDQKLSWEEILDLNGRIQLRGAGLALPEIVVAGTQYRKDLSQQRFTVNALDIQRSQSSTPAAALAGEAGAFVQMSQAGGGSPILRGFEANRVLLVIDGVRMNNAIYRSGHLQNAITVDENALSAMEVSYGPGALAYGSDALGGVIHFQTKNPLPTGSDGRSWSGSVGIRAADASAESSVFTDIIYRSPKWSAYSAITASRFGDLRAGSHRPAAFPDFGKRFNYVQREGGEDKIVVNNKPNRQIGSGYEQIDFLQKITWQPTEKLRLQLNVQYSTSGNVPRYDRLTETRNGLLRFSEWYYGPQNRALISVQAYWKTAAAWADEIRLIASHQSIAEDRFERPIQREWREESLVRVGVNNLTIDANKRLNQHSSFQYGLNGRFEQVAASAERQSIENGNVLFDINTRYPSHGSTLQAAGVFFQYRYQNKDSTLLAEAGTRWSKQTLFGEFGAEDPIQWPTAYIEGIQNKTSTLNGAAGLRWLLRSWTIQTHLASGFRAPNIDDFVKFREKGGFVQIPNPGLRAERSVSGDLGLVFQPDPQTQVQLSIYRTWLKDAMVRENFTLPDGQNVLQSRGDTFYVQAIVNAESARVWGLSFSWKKNIESNWQFNGQLHYTYGRRDFLLGNQVIDVPLDHIPPLYGQFRLRYKGKRWESSLQWQFQSVKKVSDYAVSAISMTGTDELIYDRSGTSDNLEFTPVDRVSGQFTGSYGWSVWNWQISYQIGKKYRIRINCDNIFDLHYRPFASGISAAGRNLVFGVYGWF